MAAVFIPLGRASGSLSHALCAKRTRVRFGLAFLLSLLAHAWLLPGSSGKGAMPAAQPAAALTAWLQPAGPASDGLPEFAQQELVRVPAVRQDQDALPPALANRPTPTAPATAAESALNPAPTGPVPLSAADDTYYSVRELDTYPAPLAPLAFRYPGSAAAERAHGTVTLELLIDAVGTVKEVKVLSAEPPGYFEDAARSVLVGMRFAPGRRNGQAVRSRVTINVDYSPDALR